MNLSFRSPPIEGILLAAFLAAGLSLIAPPEATASPWTLPQHQLVLDISHDFQVADREFLPDGTLQSFPLEGIFRAHNARFGARYGFTDRFEGAATFNISMITYSAVPIILEDDPEGTSSAELTDTIRNFSTNRFGAGDIHLHGRYALLVADLIRITSESTAKLPTGYEAPQGTFRANPDGSTDIVGQATLGDGQTDITQSLLFGAYIPPTNTFVRADMGLRFRFGAPGHQGVAALRAGQFLGESFLLTAGISGALTLLPGDVVGDSFITRNPTLAPRDISPSDIEVIDFRLDHDALRLEAGGLIQLGDFEFVASYSRTLWGRNTSQVNSFSISAIFAFPDITR